MEPRTPMTLITGPLGSGKTTLLRHILEVVPQKLAILMNEFGEIAIAEGMETTHYTIVDADGNIVTNTYTINDLYGSRVTAKGTGVLLNDEMDDFAARPGKPNLFGLVQGERNKVEGGKRPLSSMTPTSATGR